LSGAGGGVKREGKKRGRPLQRGLFLLLSPSEKGKSARGAASSYSFRHIGEGKGEKFCKTCHCPVICLICHHIEVRTKKKKKKKKDEGGVSPVIWGKEAIWLGTHVISFLSY